MLSADVSFGEALSSLNVDDLLKDIDRKPLLHDSDILPRKYRRNNDFEVEIKRGLDRLTKKADNCDRLLDTLSLEKTSRLGDYPLRQVSTAFDTSSFGSELNLLKETQLRLLQMVEKLQRELLEERRQKDFLVAELRARGLINSDKPLSLPQIQSKPNTGINHIAIHQETDTKYKDLKKKLLMANLKILELQNKK